jgi:prepilin-type processing-associated H-X9-DG protein
MRTKSLLLAAVLGVATVASSLAQVFSVNIVGYINKALPVGFSMVANQLNATPDNKVTTLFTAAAVEGMTIYKFNAATGGYVNVAFVDGVWEGDATMTLNPGEGAFVYTPAAATATFVGEVQLVSSVPVPAGFSILSSVIPQKAALDTGLGMPVGEGDTVYQYNPATGGYTQNAFVDGVWEGAGGGAAPQPDVAEAFFYRNAGAAKTWDRTFTVN